LSGRSAPTLPPAEKLFSCLVWMEKPWNASFCFVPNTLAFAVTSTPLDAMPY
jgi:hypothetical protein